MLRRSDETNRAYVDRVIEILLKDKSKRSELLYLIRQAEDADIMTWVTSLGYFLAHDDPDASDQRPDETDEIYVRRLVKYLIAGAEAIELEDLLSDMEGYRGNKKLFGAITAASVARSKMY
jgi:hypothetical protein